MARIDQGAGIGHKEATKPRDIQQWINPSDLLRLRGVGAEYAELLVAAGVDTLRDLRRRNPTALLAKIIGLNGPSKVGRRLPTEAMVESWIEAAKDLKPSL